MNCKEKLRAIESVIDSSLLKLKARINEVDERANNTKTESSAIFAAGIHIGMCELEFVKKEKDKIVHSENFRP